MKLREYENRFQDGNLTGAVINVSGYGELVIRMYSPNLAWFMYPSDYKQGSGKIILVEMASEKLLNSEVIYYINKTPLMEGDRVYIEGDGRLTIVTHIKEGDGSPYPIVTDRGQYEWGEIRGIGKKESKDW